MTSVTTLGKTALTTSRARWTSKAMARTNSGPLHAPIEPFATGMLDVTDGHRIYWEQSGNPKGRPVVILHGGPGGGSNPTMRRFHDPSVYRIILFDQRGCGRSTPRASLTANTTWHLVADMEHLREHLGIASWQLFGGSWGSTLALAYAVTCPERVSAMILRGVFLLRRAELDWFYQTGARWIFPEAYQALAGALPEGERGTVLASYHRRVTSDDLAIALPAARAWTTWESTTLSLVPDPDRLLMFPSETEALAFARIECHYFVNGGFFRSDGWLLEQTPRIAHIPAILVQGRYDMVTPPKSAFDLAARLPAARLHLVADAGHAMTEPGITAALVNATRALA
jgi:proline iminopeptidase